MAASHPRPPRAVFDQVARAFDLGPVRSVDRWGSGHIHDSFRLTSVGDAGPRGTLVQRVNEAVFPDVVPLMASMERVTTHLRAHVLRRGEPDPARRVLTVLRTVEGEPCWRRPEDGSRWRAFPFVARTRTVDRVASPAMARAAAMACAVFSGFQAVPTRASTG